MLTFTNVFGSFGGWFLVCFWCSFFFGCWFAPWFRFFSGCLFHEGVSFNLPKLPRWPNLRPALGAQKAKRVCEKNLTVWCHSAQCVSLLFSSLPVPPFFFSTQLGQVTNSWQFLQVKWPVNSILGEGTSQMTLSILVAQWVPLRSIIPTIFIPGGKPTYRQVILLHGNCSVHWFSLNQVTLYRPFVTQSRCLTLSRNNAAKDWPHSTRKNKAAALAFVEPCVWAACRWDKVNKT